MLRDEVVIYSGREWGFVASKRMKCQTFGIRKTEPNPTKSSNKLKENLLGCPHSGLLLYCACPHVAICECHTPATSGSFFQSNNSLWRRLNRIDFSKQVVTLSEKGIKITPQTLIRKFEILAIWNWFHGGMADWRGTLFWTEKKSESFCDFTHILVWEMTVQSLDHSQIKE